jgi:regulator of replication initiation timing
MQINPSAVLLLVSRLQEELAMLAQQNTELQRENESLRSQLTPKDSPK